tara:strand:- start:296 stop:538 length:243 start_codon:yes stop_codon:yes gene_type:complete
MNPVNIFKGWLLQILRPHPEGTSNTEKDSSKDQRFRNLFKARKIFLIISSFLFCLIAFGISKSFRFISWVIALSPLIVIF